MSHHQKRIDEIIEKIETKRDDYGPVLVKSVIMKQEDVWNNCSTRILPLHKSDSYDLKSKFDYGDLVFFEALISLDSLIDLVKKIPDHGSLKITLGEYEVQIEGEYFQEGYTYDSGEDYLEVGWFFERYHYRGGQKRYPKEPIVSKDLPLFPSLREAIGEYIGIDIGRYSEINGVFICLPNYGAKIEEVNVGSREIRLKIQPKGLGVKDIIGKLHCERENIKKHIDIEFEGETGIGSVGFMPDSLYAAIVSKTDNELLDSRRYYSSWESLPKGVAIDVPEYEIKELIRRGESACACMHACGKTTLMKLAKLFRTKDVGRFTRHALEYSDIEGYEILMIKELGYIDQETPESGISVLKFLSADDQGFTVEFTTRNENNRLTTEQRTISPITVISSTTRIELNKQFERRAWLLSPDESIGQTERIRRWKAKREREKSNVALGSMPETSEEHAFRVLRAFTNRLESANVILPFPNSLMKLLSPDRLRARGDFDKIIALVKLYTFVNQHRLPRLHSGNNAVVAVVVTPEIAIEVLKIAFESFATMTVGLERRTLKMLEVLKEFETKQRQDKVQQTLELGTALGAELQLPHFNEDEKELLHLNQEIISTLMTKLQRSRRTIISYLKQWCDSGWMTPTERTYRTQPHKFKMLYPISEIEKKLGLFDINKSAEQLVLEFKKEAKEWLKPTLQRILGEHGPVNYDVIRHFT